MFDEFAVRGRVRSRSQCSSAQAAQRCASSQAAEARPLANQSRQSRCSPLGPARARRGLHEGGRQKFACRGERAAQRGAARRTVDEEETDAMVALSAAAVAATRVT